MRDEDVQREINNMTTGWRKRQIIKYDDDDIQDYMRLWVGLTDEEIKSIWLSGKDYGDDWLDIQGIARVIEAKLKEKNHG
jgi:hypothetical protein